MERHVNSFLKYLIIEKNSSPHTVSKYTFELKNLTTFLKKRYSLIDFNKIQTSDLRQYFEYIRDKGVLCPSSISNKIAIAKSFFRYLNENSIIDFNPAALLRLPRKPRKIPKFLNDIELAKLLAAPDRVRNRRLIGSLLQDKLILHLLAYTGLRKSELLNLNCDDINLGSRYLIVRKGKNKTDRMIPLHGDVMSLLDEYLSARLPLKNRALLVSQTGNRLSSSSLEYMYKKYLRFSGLAGKKYTLHTLSYPNLNKIQTF
jgi:site-specific recombinase XerD